MKAQWNKTLHFRFETINRNGRRDVLWTTSSAEGPSAKDVVAVLELKNRNVLNLKEFAKAKADTDSLQGGILAEAMGLGKIVIFLALVLTTKGHTVRLPSRYAACSA